MNEDLVTVLCAGPGLGFYVPGAILARDLQRRQRVDLVIFESLLPPAKQSIVRRSRAAFHRDFRLALMAQRMVRDSTSDLDDEAVNALLLQWKRERRRQFVAFSGFWAPLLGRYIREIAPAKVIADYCHVDSVASASWSLVGARPPAARDVWFVCSNNRRLNYRLDIGGL